MQTRVHRNKPNKPVAVNVGGLIVSQKQNTLTLTCLRIRTSNSSAEG